MYVCRTGWVGFRVGVMGETGGRAGEADRDFAVEDGDLVAFGEVVTEKGDIVFG